MSGIPVLSVGASVHAGGSVPYLSCGAGNAGHSVGVGIGGAVGGALPIVVDVEAGALSAWAADKVEVGVGEVEDGGLGVEEEALAGV